jgi:hypothetical protein
MKAVLTTFLILAVWQSDSQAELSSAVGEAVATWMAATDPVTADDWPVYQTALLAQEDLQPVFMELQTSEDARAPWLLAKLQWRNGEIDDALKTFEILVDATDHPTALFHVAQLQDSKGDAKEAVVTYLKLLEREDAAAYHGRVRLRLAILKSTGAKVEGELEDLATYAEGKDVALRNRSAVVLALSGKPKDAIALYEVNAEDPNARFKQEIRVAEWSMAAKEMSQAQEAAWRAFGLAKLKRDKRYALTILAEAYRRDKKIGQLVERFAAEETLGDEARFLWIDLLRELGKADEALALFKQADESDFTTEMRRELLEICRETGSEDLFIDTYRDTIAREPARLDWRAGLSRFYLERGERDLGRAVWEGFENLAQGDALLGGAGVALDLGLEDLASDYAESCITQGTRAMPALQFLFDMHKARGRDEALARVLERMEGLAPADSADRVQLAESWEQVGRQDKAVDVLERLRAARGPERFSSDLEMRLAWLHSEVGDEEKAYEYWRNVWLRVESPGRRRYVEDRLMATASRLGKLADIAIELEEKLVEGTANKRDSALLVRLYTKVNDPVSATEIIQEFMKQSGESEIAMLEEKARIYAICNDYYHYERTLRQLMDLDPEGGPEYLTQLAMSCLERGKNDQAQQVLTEMRELEKNPASSEFEAGVLKIAGMHTEATKAYWRGIAEHPGRIDAYLLLGQSLQETGKAKQAQGMFQYLVEHADKDDLFTIAVDGLLNARAPRSVMDWARRVILERLAGRDDKVYLYQLLADLSEEVRDQKMMMAAVAETLPIAGERRTSQLRELMELAKAGVGGRSTGSTKDRKGLLRFGRRLVGMGEAVPPQVHLDIGQAFLDAGEVRNAEMTFARAEDLSDYAGFQRKVAQSLEQKLYVKSALRTYEKLLLGDHADVGLILKLGELKEQLGRDAEANIAFARALNQLIDLQPLVTAKKENTQLARNAYARNQDDYSKYFPRAMKGFLATATPGEALESFLKAQEEELLNDVSRVLQQDEVEKPVLGQVGRIHKRTGLLRRIGLAFDQEVRVKRACETLLRCLPNDDTLLISLGRTLIAWGHKSMARDLIKAHGDHASAEKAVKWVGKQSSGNDADSMFRVLMESSPREARRQLGKAVADHRGQQDQRYNELLAAAKYMRDAALLEQLARKAILATPKDRLYQMTSSLRRVWPYVDASARDSLVELVEGKIDLEDDQYGSMIYYLNDLARLTGRTFSIPIDGLRDPLQKALGQGGYYLNQISGYFSLLSREDYVSLLKEAFQNAKKSDRLLVLFTLIKSHKAEMDPSLRELFVELVKEAAADGVADPVAAWNLARGDYYSYDGREHQLELGAELLSALAKTAEKDKRPDLDSLLARVLYQAGQEEEGLTIAKRVLALSLQKDSPVASNLVSMMQSVYLPKYLPAFLEVYDGLENEAKTVAIENKRITMIRSCRDQVALLAAMGESVQRFPEEASYRQNLTRQLETMGLVYESLAVQQALVDKEPHQQLHRTQLAALWTKLEHPVNAAKAKEMPKKEMDEKGEAKREEEEGPKPTVQVAPQAAVSPVTTAAAIQTPAVTLKPTTSAVVAKSANKETKDEEDEVSKPEKLEPVTVMALKKAIEGEKPEDARVAMRRLWRQFEQYVVERPYYYSSGGNLGRFRWPDQEPAKTEEPKVTSLRGGLEAFLKSDPPKVAERPGPLDIVTLFEKLIDEEIVRDEMMRWMRGLEAHEFSNPVFKRQVQVLAQHRVTKLGIEAALNKALKTLDSGAVDPIEKAIVIALLEIGSKEGAAASAALRDRLFEGEQYGVPGQVFLLARCYAMAGETAMAERMYRWCASQTAFTRYNYGDGRLTTMSLIQDIESHLKGDAQLRAIEAVFDLGRPTNDNRSEGMFDAVVLETWKRLVPPQEAISRTAEICDKVLGDPTVEQVALLRPVALFFASAGHLDKASEALKLALTRKGSNRNSTMRAVYTTSGALVYVSTKSSSSQQMRRFTDADLHAFFPKSLSDWVDGQGWLRKASQLMIGLAKNGQLPTSDAGRSLGLIAVRQHQLGDAASANQSLERLRALKLTLAEDRLWFSDAARALGHDKLALDVELGLLNDRQLNLERVDDLMRGYQKVYGKEAALALGGDTLKYTMHADFLSEMCALSQDVTWQKHLTEMLAAETKPERFGYVFKSDGQETLFRFEELASERLIHDKSHVVYFDEETRQARAYQRNGHAFAWKDDQVVDANDKVWNLMAGESLTAVPLRVTYTSNWRAEHPEGEVYLVSLLENAKTLIVEKAAEDWAYQDNGQEPSAAWTKISFDDSGWAKGAAPLGYGEALCKTTISFGGDSSNKHLTAYFRKVVSIEDSAKIAKYYANLERDDGAILYINGQEVHRSNMRPGDQDTVTTTAAGKGEKGQIDSFFLEPDLFQDGQNVIAISVHQADLSSSDTFMDFELRAITKEDLGNH